MLHEMMKNLLKERPVGSKNNRDVLLFLENTMVNMGYEVERLPFACTAWETGESHICRARSLERCRSSCRPGMVIGEKRHSCGTPSDQEGVLRLFSLRSCCFR